MGALTKREADILLSAVERRESNGTADDEEILSACEARRSTLASVLATRDHAAFSAVVYAGPRTPSRPPAL